MTETILLTNALRLPEADVLALSQGRIITALPWTFITPGQSFALFHNTSENLQKIHFWAKCELCKSIDDIKSLSILSQHTLWNLEALKSQMSERDFLFLAFLRVYKFEKPIAVPFQNSSAFIPLIESVTVSNSISVLSDTLFNQRKKQLDNWELPLHSELEALQDEFSKLAYITLSEKAFDEDLQVFFGWKDWKFNNQIDSDLVWISTISDVGNSSNGNDFEKLVRKSLLKLGFSNSLNNIKASLDPDATGGAGGIDVYCDKPFSLVGECKATKHENISNGVSAQLINLGITHLGQTLFYESVKIIFAAGNLTNAAEKAASQNHMNVIRPETLQRLVELKARHPGSINLRALEDCLRQDRFGDASDTKIRNFIDDIQNQIRLRANIVQRVKSCQESLNTKTVDASTVYTAYAVFNPPYPMEKHEISNILIELSSPLTGYLGHVKDTDHFYFLRELQID